MKGLVDTTKRPAVSIEEVKDEYDTSIRATLSTELAIEKNTKQAKKLFEELVPELYRDFAKVFSKEESQRLPEHKAWDHAIDLVLEAKGFSPKVYPLSKNKQEELDKFLEENLKKEYIRSSKSPMPSPFFFVKKKDGKLW